MKIITTIFSLSMLSAQALAAQTQPLHSGPTSRVIEEVIVSANKTEQSAQDIAGSLQALTGDFMQRANVTDFTEMSKYIPNTVLEDNGLEPTIAVRGIKTVDAVGGGDNSVALVVDDIALSRQGAFHLGFFDLERVEVLRGPQGTLFGKSTTAGVVSLISAAPTDEFSGFLTLRQGEDDQQASGAISGPITDTLSGRFSFFIDRPGPKQTNTFNGDEVGYVDRAAARIKLRWLPTENTEVNLFWTKADLDHFNVNPQFATLAESDRLFLSQYDPQVEGDAFDGQMSFDDRKQTWSPGMVLFGVRLDHDWGSPLLFDSLSSTLVLGGFDGEGFGFGDLDATAADAFRTTESHETTRIRQLEARVQGITPGLFTFGGGETEFISGVFYQDERVDVDYRITGGEDTGAYFSEGPGVQLVGGPGFPEGINCPTCLLLDPGASLAGDGIAWLPSMQTDVLGLFTQVVYRPTSKLAITAGLRYDRVNRDAVVPVRKLHPSGEGDLSVLAPALGAEEDVDLVAALREREYSSKLSLQYEFLDGDIVSYFTWSRGFKGGAVNFFSVSESSTLEVEPEFAELFEVGAKAVLFDQTLQANLSIYTSEFSDLHVYVLTDDGILPFIALANAAEARSRGVELDAMFLPAFAPWMTLSGAAAYSDATYLEYKEGPTGEDFTGKTLVGAPRWSVVITPEVTLPFSWIGDGAFISFAFDALYTDSYDSDSNLDPEKTIDESLVFNTRLSLLPPSQAWSLMLSVTNLTDEEIYATRGGTADELWPNSSFGRVVDGRHASLDFSFYW